MNTAALGFYFHIPFCLRKCSYCDFYSYHASADQLQQYFIYLEKEVSLVHKQQADGNEQVDTIYFGGGTPSLISAEQFASLIQRVRKNFSLSLNSEITMEINPGVQGSSINTYLQAGINRISIGVQSTSSKLLNFLERPYSRYQLLKFLDRLPEKKECQISLDFLYGIPGQSLEDLSADLDLIKEIHPHHVSYYQLTPYKGTPYDLKLKNNDIQPLTEDLINQQEKLIYRRLEDYGYHRYEVSNYCLEGYASRHNLKYWNLTPYIGLGEGSSSLLGTIYTENYCGGEYYRLLDEELLPVQYKTVYNPKQVFQNKLMMGLRLTDGISWHNLQELLEELGEEKELFIKKINNLLNEGILKVSRGRLKTNTNFYSVLDSILLEFI